MRQQAEICQQQNIAGSTNPHVNIHTNKKLVHEITEHGCTLQICFYAFIYK